MKKILWLLQRMLITLGLTALLFQLGKFLPYSGDGAYVEQMANMDWVVLMHSIFTTLMHKTVCTMLQPWGWSTWNSVSVSSALGGALAVQFLFAMRRDPLFLLINLLSGSFLVFVGEVENYSWVNAFLLGSFYYTERYLEGKSPLFPALLMFFIACLFHMLALFYLLPLMGVMKKYPRFAPWEFLVPFLLFALGTIACNLLFNHEGPDLDLDRLVPLFAIHRQGQHFTFFSWAHWKILAYFHVHAAFLGLPIEIPLLIWLRKGIRTPFHVFLFQCTVIGLAWTTVWYPDLGRLDWDLFSQMGIALHLLLGILLSDRAQKEHWTFAIFYRNNT